MKISPSRTAAFEILYRIETERAFSSILLPEYEARLSPKDRALCHEIALGVLRRQMLLDRMIDEFTREKSLDLAVRIAVRIGIYQLNYLDRVPAYAAISDSVSLVQRAKKTSAKGLVNAVLRNFQRGGVELTFEDETERLSVESSHPRWLIERWIGEFGPDGTRKIAEINNSQPASAFRLTANSVAGDLNLERFPKSQFVDGCYLASSMEEELTKAVANGQIYFQDEGSQMVGAVVANERFGRFLDVCAAPGSKTTQIAARAVGSPESLLVAGDLHWTRASFLRENCRSQGLGFVNVLQYDAKEALPFQDRAFDVVLVDAPCSGTGTIRHNPEIRYLLERGEIAQLSSKQLRILQNASKVVRQGGKLFYSTCSLEREENEGVCERFLARNTDFQQSSSEVPDRFVSESGFARTFPHRDDMDGFFIAAFDRLA